MRPAAYVDKVTAAERQLDTAIWLWFMDGDIISVATLAGAANGIVDALLHKRGMGRADMFAPAPNGVKPKEWINMVKEAENFAKHAREDFDKRRLYTSVETSLYLFSVVVSYERLTGFKSKFSTLRGLFGLYFAATHPGAFELNALQEVSKVINVEVAKQLSGCEFLKRMSVEDQSTVDRLPQFPSGLPPGWERPDGPF